MAYDKEKDVELASWQMDDDDSNDNVKASIHQYGGGTKKLQIGPRMFLRKDGEFRYGKLGRITKEEIEWLLSILPDVLSKMDEVEVEPENKEQMYNLD